LTACVKTLTTFVFIPYMSNDRKM